MRWYEHKILKKLFLETTEWKAAWRKLGGNKFHVIENPEGYWIADTLLFKCEKGMFLFVEAYSKKEKIGKIGVFEFDGKNFSNFKIILEKNYHLSYPYVFEYNKKYYMIPETSENKTIELYQSNKFPYEWEKVCDLMKGNYVDTTLYKNDDLFTVFTYDMSKKKYLKCELNMKNKKIVINSVIDNKEYTMRCGGNIFKYNNQLCHPLQNNINFYGQSLNIVLCDDEKKIVNIITPEKICTNDNNIYRRLHTYSKVESFEAVDLSNYKFNLFKCIKKVWYKIWKK